MLSVSSWKNNDSPRVPLLGRRLSANSTPIWVLSGGSIGLCGYFPLRENDPPDLMTLIDDRDRFRSQTMYLLEVLGLLPREIAKMVVPVTMRTVQAESEIGAILMGLLEVNMAGLDEGRSTWCWDDVQRVHAASDNPERSQDWMDIARGRCCHAAEKAWEQLVSDLEDHLHRLTGTDSQSPA
jgi:hypothetical protein